MTMNERLELLWKHEDKLYTAYPADNVIRNNVCSLDQYNILSSYGKHFANTYRDTFKSRLFRKSINILHPLTFAPLKSIVKHLNRCNVFIHIDWIPERCSFHCIDLLFLQYVLHRSDEC